MGSEFEFKVVRFRFPEIPIPLHPQSIFNYVKNLSLSPALALALALALCLSLSLSVTLALPLLLSGSLSGYGTLRAFPKGAAALWVEIC